MSNCLLCQSQLVDSLTICELFSFRPYQQPVICSKCLVGFTPIKKGHSCLGCSRPQKTQEYCLDCVKWQKWYPNLIVKHIAFFEYDIPFKKYLHTYKFQGDTRLSSVFVSEIRQIFHQNRDAWIVPLPISVASTYERGFNQSEEILRAAQVPYLNLLDNVYTGKKQSEKDRQERLYTPQPFQLIQKNFLTEKRIILFDDVYTTGRTLLHAKELLDSYGCKDVTSITLAR